MTSSPSSSSSAASTSPSYTTSAFPELTPHIQPSSSTALSALLSANHASHHCFFNTRGMHNHSLHELIADLTLGASPTQLQTHYAYQIKHYLSGFTLNDRTKYNPHFAANNVNVNVKIEKKISEGNWREYVGDARYYWSYLRFFEVQVERFGLREVLERYVFGEEANEGEGEGMMMARFYGGVLHALIHFGYALEMREGKIAAEALAMATSTAASHAWLFDYDWLFERVEGVKGERKGLLELVGEIQRDERLSVDALGLKEEDASLPDRPFEGKGLPKQADGVAYKHDFFLMHLNREEDVQSWQHEVAELCKQSRTRRHKQQLGNPRTTTTPGNRQAKLINLRFE